jgi:hypothetical protein
VVEVAMTAKLLVRVSDNVLDKSEWGVSEITLRTVRRRTATSLEVTAQYQLSEGCYVIPDMSRWDVRQVAEWTRADPTGRHPECYNELAVVAGSERPQFRAFWTSQDLQNALLFALLR